MKNRFHFKVGLLHVNFQTLLATVLSKVSVTREQQVWMKIIWQASLQVFHLPQINQSLWTIAHLMTSFIPKQEENLFQKSFQWRLWHRIMANKGYPRAIRTNKTIIHPNFKNNIKVVLNRFLNSNRSNRWMQDLNNQCIRGTLQSNQDSSNLR